MTKQIKHARVSTKGKVFAAGSKQKNEVGRMNVGDNVLIRVKSNWSGPGDYGSSSITMRAAVGMKELLYKPGTIIKRTETSEGDLYLVEWKITTKDAFSLDKSVDIQKRLERYDEGAIILKLFRRDLTYAVEGDISDARVLEILRETREVPIPNDD